MCTSKGRSGDSGRAGLRNASRKASSALLLVYSTCSPALSQATHGILFSKGSNKNMHVLFHLAREFLLSIDIGMKAVPGG